MFWFVVAMLGILVVAFVVISKFSEEEDDWSKRPGHSGPDEGHLEDLLGP